MTKKIIKRIIVRETKRLARKYFGVNPEVTFGLPTLNDKVVKGLTSIEIRPNGVKYRIVYNNMMLSWKDNSVIRDTFSTIVHEVCHLAWFHGEPNFKKSVLSILRKEGSESDDWKKS
jgi:hypothetical protein